MDALLALSIWRAHELDSQSPARDFHSQPSGTRGALRKEGEKQRQRLQQPDILDILIVAIHARCLSFTGASTKAWGS